MPAHAADPMDVSCPEFQEAIIAGEAEPFESRIKAGIDHYFGEYSKDVAKLIYDEEVGQSGHEKATEAYWKAYENVSRGAAIGKQALAEEIVRRRGVIGFMINECINPHRTLQGIVYGWAGVGLDRYIEQEVGEEAGE